MYFISNNAVYQIVLLKIDTIIVIRIRTRLYYVVRKTLNMCVII